MPCRKLLVDFCISRKNFSILDMTRNKPFILTLIYKKPYPITVSDNGFLWESFHTEYTDEEKFSFPSEKDCSSLVEKIKKNPQYCSKCHDNENDCQMIPFYGPLFPDPGLRRNCGTPEAGPLEKASIHLLRISLPHHKEP